MGLQTCVLNLNRANEELAPHGTTEFPCAGYRAEYGNHAEDVIPWHWHKEIELVYVKKGALKLQTPAQTFFIQQGDCAAINSNVLHYAVAKPWCELHSIVFHPLLVTGSNESIFACKYLTPLASCASFDACLMSSECEPMVISSFAMALEVLAVNAPHYEFIVREKLTAICLRLYELFEHEIKVGNRGFNQDSVRVQQMLDYIHKNVGGSPSLAEIAAVAGIGERECLRCFRKTIQTSPMQYLLKYKVTYGASLLLQRPADSVTEISARSGFDSPSNFAKMFRRFYTCTPREYRARAQQRVL